MKKICVNLSYCLGLGDLLASTPMIRKISNSYDVKVDVVTNNKEVFINNPFINKTYLPSEFDFSDSSYEVFKTFDPFEENSKPISLYVNIMQLNWE
jgi:ADP-heptose:LPS heptosyltransferase